MTEKRRRAPVVVLGFLAAILTAILWAEPNYTVEYPQGYRSWTHVTSSLIGPQSPAYEKSGGLHHFYANEKALEGYRTGKFPDGSILVDERNKAEETSGIAKTGDRLGVAVMIKDSRRYAETGGWGFEVFPGDDPTSGVLNVQGRVGCFNCHVKQMEQDLVFTKRRE